jgi:uncharacterized membrane protein
MNVDFTTPRVLAYAIFAIVACLLAALFVVPIPAPNKEMLGTVTQTLLTILVAAAGFYWGSSLGSREKDNKGEVVNVTPPVQP